MRGNSCSLPGRRFERRAAARSIKSRLKMPKLPKYEGKRDFRLRVINRSATGSTSRSSFRFTRVKALLMLGNQIFIGHVHILFTRAFLSSPAAGLRLEIATNIDKKKSELYFYLPVKKFLTKKAKRACPQSNKFSFHRLHDLIRAHRHFLCSNRLLMCCSAVQPTCRAS
jgi:hypothetical protein